MSDDDPQFGYGAGGRPLWTVRDRDAEVIRTVLRKAGSRKFSERHGGFVVEGGQDGAPFAIACADDADIAVRELARYKEALRKVGYRLQRDPDDDQTLLAWPTGDPMRSS
ncbi:hypothetical protein ACFY05_40080 [Microtetraspora fusca]|uniref:DUF2188 domain-containing protein n=1 Tax=Microtetraspora fusca TaxID=1997 RepID=A0ABW6VI49_MICFU